MRNNDEKKFLSSQCCISICVAILGAGIFLLSPEGQQICASCLEKVNQKIEGVNKSNK